MHTGRSKKTPTVSVGGVGGNMTELTLRECRINIGKVKINLKKNSYRKLKQEIKLSCGKKSQQGG